MANVMTSVANPMTSIANSFNYFYG